uniref:DUF2451 domain-containing protein n=1 Tax=Soboliphyme baturini TaxID=241478 RepID=A0A183IYK3_9BILA
LFRFLKTYERLCKSSLNQFGNTVRAKCLEVFENYHQRCMEDVKMFIETDAWQKVPVKRGFSWHLLPEFREPCKLKQQTGHNNPAEELVEWHLATDPETCNPFEVTNLRDVQDSDSISESSGSDDSDIFDEAQPALNEEDDLMDEQQLPAFHTPARRLPIDQLGPLLSNSALILLRFFGRYLQFACLLESVAADVIVPLAELYEYYFVSVYSEENALSAESLVTFMNRVVGVESLIFVSDQLVDVLPVIEPLLPKIKQAFLRLFTSQSLKPARLMRKPAYCAVGKVFVNYGGILENMSAVNWDVKELMQRHSPFTDIIIEELKKLQAFLTPRTPQICIPEEVWTTVWCGLGEKLFAILVEGFSDAKKCTDEGRALMQRNFQQLLINLETIAEKKLTAGKDLVENYIKAFYMNDASIEQWIKENRSVCKICFITFGKSLM